MNKKVKTTHVIENVVPELAGLYVEMEATLIYNLLVQLIIMF